MCIGVCGERKRASKSERERGEREREREREKFDTFAGTKTPVEPF
jgi:hypothetical protein